MKINKQFYYVIGNHDATNNQIFLSDDHAFNSFKNWHENLIIVDKPIKRDNVMFLPYVPVGRFKEATDVLGLDGINVIFCHQEFRGCKLGAKISEHGDIWEENLPIVISGHIHERSMVGNNILYVGSPYQTSFGDNSKKSIELVEINGSSIDTKPIELNMPKRITLNLTVAEFATVELPESIDYIRINVSGTLQDIASLKKSKKFKQISEIAKVVPKITDNMVISRNTKGKSFGELLAESMSGLSDEVKQEYEDILRSVT